MLELFGELPAYQINQEKFILMKVHVGRTIQEQVGLFTNARWKSSRHLGVLLSREVKDLVEDNITPLIKEYGSTI